MSVRLEVGLLSGRTVKLEPCLGGTVATLKRGAQDALNVGLGQLLNSSGDVLDEASTVKKARLQDGECLIFKMRQTELASARYTVAAILGNGSVVTWGLNFGDDSSAVQDKLKNVQQIQSSRRAFAAILADGSVVTWGDAACGGDSSAVQEQLKNVERIQSSMFAFAAILGDGSVVT